MCSPMKRRIHIEAVSPAIEGGAYAIKRVVGDEIAASADILRDGHNAIRAQVRWCDGRIPNAEWEVRPMIPEVNDRWEARFVLARNTTVHFCIDAWADAFTTWVGGLR